MGASNMEEMRGERDGRGEYTHTFKQEEALKKVQVQRNTLPSPAKLMNVFVLVLSSSALVPS